jgi:mRNA-degrading endonuclease toxin of MazEF toxin-antitoxin module
MPVMIRSLSIARLHRRLGVASPDTVTAVASRAAVLIGLGRVR